MTKVTIICSTEAHPVYSRLRNWVDSEVNPYQASLVKTASEATGGGDLLFLVSCSEIVSRAARKHFQHTLVLHASDVPKGRGWSPHVWDILKGKDRIVLSLLEAADGVDTGRIWRKKEIQLDGTELYDEINALLFDAEIELIEWACANFNDVQPVEQSGIADYYKRRNREDSRLDPDKTISQQMNLLRVCDPDRFPAFFDCKGQRYTIRIQKENKE